MNRFASMVLLSLALAAGCAAPEPRRDSTPPPEDTLARIQQALAPPTASDAEVPAAVASALLPPLAFAAEDGAAGDTLPRFDLSVTNVRAEPFFMGLVRDTDFNMVVHPSVDGTISLDLKNVTVPEVMRLVRQVYGYEYEESGAGYVVLPRRLSSRIFNVSYVNLKRVGASTTRVNSGQVSDTHTEKSGDDESATKTRRTIGSEIVTESETDFWSQIETSVRSIIGGGEERSVVVSPQAGLVVVRAMPGELRDVEQFLRAAQDSLHKQVILEAKVIEVQLSDAFQSGINWAALGTSNGASAGFGQFSIIDGAASALTDDLDFANDALARPGRQDAFPFAGMFAFGAGSDDFAALITLLNTQGETQVLSSPRVATMNNQKAVIKVGTDEFFVTEIESTTVTGTTTTTSPSITLTPFFSGIALDVTPHVTTEDEVILHIHPTVSEVQDQTKNITVAGQTQSLPLAFSSVRESDSVVRAGNGQVVVIGGLMQDRNQTEQGKTPFLGDLPLLGALFRQDRDVSARSELVILLRPIVVGGDNTWRNTMSEAAQRIGAMRRGGAGAQ